MIPITVTRHSTDTLEIEVHRKRITRLRLSVREGRVILGIPYTYDLAYAVAFREKLDWIRQQQARIESLPKPKQFVSQECHRLWGYPHTLVVTEQ